MNAYYRGSPFVFFSPLGCHGGGNKSQILPHRYRGRGAEYSQEGRSHRSHPLIYPNVRGESQIGSRSLLDRRGCNRTAKRSRIEKRLNLEKWRGLREM